MKKQRFIIAGAGAAVALTAAFCSYGLFSPMSSEEDAYLYIHRNTTPQEVKTSIAELSGAPQAFAFRLLATVTGYYSNIRPGAYNLGDGHSTLSTFRHMRNGTETPVRLTIPSTLRTVSDLADFLGEHLEPSADAFYGALKNQELLAQYGLQPETATCLFLPNTYEVYWSTTIEHFLERMKHESDVFWTDERDSRLADIAGGISREEAITLASIVEQETQYNPERPAVAGMYINRLVKGMPLQADPTVKFAVGDFGIKRILHKHLETDSPYNTYKHAGLPPGPICIPSLASIDAVLHYQKHSYIYMCAKEDFSGSHNFATTYSEHLTNAHKYAKALDEHNVH